MFDVQSTARLVLNLRRMGVDDPSLLARFEAVPPEAFGLDIEGMIKSGALEQLITQLTALELSAKDGTRAAARFTMLQIGTGSAYAAALFAGFARRLYTIERDAEKYRAARQIFSRLKITNISAKHGDGSAGWAEMAPFARISISPALPAPPAELATQLAPGGFMIAPLEQSLREAGQEKQMLTLIEVKEKDIFLRPLIPSSQAMIKTGPLWQQRGQ